MCATVAHHNNAARPVPFGAGISVDDCDGSHYERETQDILVLANIRARVEDVSWLIPWREWYEE